MLTPLVPAAARRPAARLAVLSATALLSAAGAPAAAQTTFALQMQGTLDARSSLVFGGVATPFAGPSAFTLEAIFDASGPNLVAPIPVPGFRAYTPSAARLTIGGRTYDLQAFGAATPLGVAVAIFDATSPFGPPGRYGVGLIQNPLADGAGFVADYGGASPAFTFAASGVVPTVFTQYYGVGVSSGVCTVGTPASCQAHAVTPIPMTWAGQAFALSLGNYEEDLAAGGALWTASLVTVTATPEPATVALMGAGLLVLGAAGARRRQVAGGR